MTEAIYLRHAVGRCPVCGVPILDSGYDDDPEKWEHAAVMPGV
jgi:hypothetical protein